MSGLLPSESDATPDQAGELRTLWLDSEGAGELLSCLSSETARKVLTSLHEEPATASEVSDRVDTSLQNARHHLNNLEEAGLVRVADTRYSSKGREMNVYAPAEEPMVVMVGREESGMDVLRDLVPAVGLLALASLLVQYFVSLSVGAVQAPAGMPRYGQDLAPVADALFVSAPPGALFFLGGLLALTAVVAWRRYAPLD